MKNLLQILTLLLLTACSPNNPTPHHNSTSNQASTKEAKLKLDTKGHTGVIRDIIVTKSGDIISASDDKTIRVWSSKTGKEKRKILGQIGAGSEGKIFAMALSPNEEFLAVGGFMGTYTGKKNKKDEEAHWIRIYNYPTGRLIKVLKSHRDVVYDLSFSQDGKYLISGSADRTAKIWEVNSFRLKDTLSFHTNDVYAVKIIQKNGNYFAITAGYDNQIALYNMQTKKIKSFRANYKLQFLATSKEHIAVCGKGREILIFDTNLNFLKKIKSETVPHGLAYSPTGKFLIVGTGGHPLNVNIYSKTQNYQNISSFKKHKNTTIAVNFLDKQTAISAGGNNFEIYIWSIKNGRVLKKIEGVGEIVWSVGIRGDTIGWGNILDIKEKNNNATLRKILNLKTFRVKSEKEKIKNLKRISTTYKDYSLIHTRGGAYGYSDATLLIKKQGRIIAKITRDATNGYRHNCYGFYKNYIISGGSGGFLKIYNLEGREIANLVGHTGEVFSIALDGDRLVSGSDDQTIRVWDLSKLKINSEKLKINEKYISLIMKQYNISRESVIKQAKKMDDTNIYSNFPTLRPQLNIFITKKNKWIAWTPQGFYNASKGAEQYIGYHINQGAKKEAEFLDIKRFKKQFYRPDLIQKAINGEDISSYAKNIDINSLLEAGLPPKVKILNNSTNINDESIEVVVDICDEGGSFDNLRFYVDDAPIKYLSQTKAFQHQKKVHGNCTLIEQTISVPSGTHTIGFNATNKEGNIISNTPTITITNTKKTERKPNLHILTLSVADYKDDSLDLTYPNNDAKEVISKLQKIKNSVFDKVYPYSLKDSEVTYSNILKKVKEIAKKVQGEDVFILYVSGHGVTDDSNGNYYFIPYACPNSENIDLEAYAISHDKLQRIIEEVGSSKSAVFLDTCESGGMVEKQGSLDASVQRFGGNIGRAIIAGATSKQNALDGYKKHGIFTYTVLDAMNNKKVYDFEDKISIGDIAQYVKKVLPRLAKKEFGHEQKATIYMHGDTTFPIGEIKK